jgi:cytochrome c biogenesis protein CcdA
VICFTFAAVDLRRPSGLLRVASSLSACQAQPGAGLPRQTAFIAGSLTALIIVVAFVSAMFHVAHEYGVAILFIGALLLFCMSLIDLARETRIALHDNDLRM